MSDNGLGNLDNLFQGAQQDGLTGDTMDLVVANLNGPTMVGAVGISLQQIASNDVTLAMNIIDRSSSMAPFSAELITAYNDDYLAAMRDSTEAEDILVSTILFNHEVELFHGYVGLPDAPPLTRRVFSPSGTTALYDAVAGGLTNMVLYAQQLRASGIMVRCLVIVYSDGEDNQSRQRAADVRRAARELLKHEIYTLAYVGFAGSGIQQAQLRKMADDIGFPEALLAGLSHAELRRIFQLASRSTLRVSRNGGTTAGVFAP